jgi:hypothetical protein
MFIADEPRWLTAEWSWLPEHDPRPCARDRRELICASTMPFVTWLAGGPPRFVGHAGRAAAVLLALAAVLIAARPASAHGLAMSQLRLRVDGTRVEGEWEVLLRDARLAVNLDPQVTGEAGWRDLDVHKEALRAYVVRRLAVEGETQCPVEATSAPLEWNPGQDQVVVHLAADCTSPPVRLHVRCDFLFDVDPSHHAYFSVDDARVTQFGVFRDDQRAVTVEVHQFHAWGIFVEFVREGALHIASGMDHVVFLLALLLPAPLVRARLDWSPRVGLASTGREVVKVVTAFTVAHSLTLCLSYFGVVAPPARWVEVAIAVSVAAAAWNNLRPFLPGRAWTIALVFGLVHGLGFAGALKNLSLPNQARGLALAAFNVGVELGQLSIVLAILPVLYAASRRTWYPRVVMGACSFVIAWVAVLWTVQRAFGVSLLT